MPVHQYISDSSHTDRCRPVRPISRQLISFLLCKDSHQQFSSSRPSILKQPAQFMYFTYIKKIKAGRDSGCGFSHLLYYTVISYFCEYGIHCIAAL